MSGEEQIFGEVVSLREPSEAISLKRAFRLGDYKSLHVEAHPSELDDREKFLLAVDLVADAYITLFVHQIFNAKVRGEDPTHWVESIKNVKRIKEEVKNLEV